MKIAGLIIGILGLLLAFIGLIISLMLPSMTNNRVNFSESLIFIIISVVIGFFAFIITLVSAIMLIKSRKAK